MKTTKFPNCEIQIGKNKYTAVAKEIFDEEREDWWSKMDYMNKGGYSNYQKRTERKIPVLILNFDTGAKSQYQNSPKCE